jgi:hypothetical protein
VSKAISLFAKALFIDDMPGASIPSSRLNKILVDLEAGKPLSNLARKYLAEQNLNSLLKRFDGEISNLEYARLAADEREARLQVRKIAEAEEERKRGERKAAVDRKQAEMLEKQNEKQKQEQKHAKRYERRPLAGIPARRSQSQADRQLRNKYDVDHSIQHNEMKPLMGILRKLSTRTRLTEKDVVFLRTMEIERPLTQVLREHHRIEADFYLAEYKKTKDVWQLVNASGHLRRCKASAEAEKLFADIQLDAMQSKKLKSAALTTSGGVQRDLGNSEKAMKLALEAHNLQPKSYRPCTLLGALYMEAGEFSNGHCWYEKAVSLGAPEDSVKHDIKAILRTMQPKAREKAINELLAISPQKYAWLNQIDGTKQAAKKKG